MNYKCWAAYSPRCCNSRSSSKAGRRPIAFCSLFFGVKNLLTQLIQLGIGIKTSACLHLTNVRKLNERIARPDWHRRKRDRQHHEASPERRIQPFAYGGRHGKVHKRPC